MKRFTTLLLAALLLCGCFTLGAADTAYTNSFEIGGATIRVPDNWYSVYTDNGFIYIYGPTGVNSGYLCATVFDESQILTGTESEETLWEYYKLFAESMVTSAEDMLSTPEYFPVAGRNAYYYVFRSHDVPAYAVLLFYEKSLFVCFVTNVTEAEAKTIFSGVTIG